MVPRPCHLHWKTQSFRPSFPKMSPPRSPEPSMFATSVNPSRPRSRSTWRGNRLGPPAMRTGGLRNDSVIVRGRPFVFGGGEFLFQQQAAKPAPREFLRRPARRVLGEQTNVTAIARYTAHRQGTGVRVLVGSVSGPEHPAVEKRLRAALHHAGQGAGRDMAHPLTRRAGFG